MSVHYNNDPAEKATQEWGAEAEAQREATRQSVAATRAQHEAQERQRLAADRFANPEKYRQIDAMAAKYREAQKEATMAEQQMERGVEQGATVGEASFQATRDLHRGLTNSLRAKAGMLAQLAGLSDANGG